MPAFYISFQVHYNFLLNNPVRINNNEVQGFQFKSLNYIKNEPKAVEQISCLLFTIIFLCQVNQQEEAFVQVKLEHLLQFTGVSVINLCLFGLLRIRDCNPLFRQLLISIVARIPINGSFVPWKAD